MAHRHWLALLIALSAPAIAVEVRVATFNVGAQFTESSSGIFYPEFGLGAVGTPDHENVKAVLARIDADVVALQEIDNADVAGSPSAVQALAASLGYPHLYVAPVGGSGGLVAPFDSDLRVAVLSRHPFLSTTAIRSPAGAKELTRLHPVVKVDVPGTANDLTLVSAHLKSGTTAADKFRRAVEMRRLAGYLGSSGVTGNDNFVVLGDFNLSSSNSTYSTLPSGLPSTYSLGGDISLPVSYSTNPLSYYSSPTVVRLDPRQVNGAAATFQSGSVLDLLLVSPAIAGRLNQSEVYNSALDTSNAVGLPKAGDPLAAGTSSAASDHFAVFADLEMDADQPELMIALSSPGVTEGLPAGPLTATVTLPALRPTAVDVLISSDDPGVIPAASQISIPPGSLSGSVSVAVPRDFIAGTTRTAGFTASSAGYDPATAVLQVEDADAPYTFTAAGQTITEDFDGFAGTYDPAPWTTTGGAAWVGEDSGASTAPGLRAYGSGVERALGYLSSDTPAAAVTLYQNGSPQTLTAVEVRYDIEQWRAAVSGAADTVSAEIFHAGQVHPLPGLTHVAATTLPTGPVAGGLTTLRRAILTGLSIPPGGSFELRVRFTPDTAGAPLPTEVFVNEFHYDNVGDDVDEFVEVVIAPGFSGTADDIDFIPYNGSTPSAAVPYSIPGYGSVIRLSSFVEGATVQGFRFYTLTAPTNGIQNGGNDGFALIDRRSGEVLQLISYEGVFTAAPGTPAAGLTAVNVGVSQSGTTPVGSALRLTGSGAGAGDFLWTGGTSTKGLPNDGQTFILPGLPPQGLAVDQVRVTAFAGQDTDGDGQADEEELAFGTDPQDAASVFAPVITRAGGLWLTFPGASGIAYTVERSTDLVGWQTLSTHAGTGATIQVPLPTAAEAEFFRVRAGE